ncbi:Retrovirus-related Pol polyprotein from transposon TNT 1-94, partial [Eumeta japonica]
MAASSLYQIEKLDEKNFETWSVQVKSVLIHCGYWNYVSGEEKKIETWDADRKLEWDTNDRKALATIILSIKSTQINYVKNCATSNEAWLKLTEIYKRSGPIQKVNLFKQLLNLNMKESTSMVEFLNSFSNIVEKLNEAGIQIQDELLAIILLSSLPKDYENFVMIIETRDTLPSLSVIKVKLLEEASRRNNQESEDSNKQQAFRAFKNENFNKQKDVRNKSNVKYTKGNCFICGRKGHYANRCTAKGESKSFSLVAAANRGVRKPSAWCIDSGATSHMCCERDSFSTIQDNNDVISLPNKKSLCAKGKGVVIVRINGHNITLKDVLYSPELQGNFLSVGKIIQYGGAVKFNRKGAFINDKDGSLLIHAKQENNLFMFEAEKVNEELNSVKNINQMWHRRFGHLNYQSLNDLVNKGMVNGLNLSRDIQEQCKTCMVGKIHAAKFPQKAERKSGEVLE